MEFEAMSRNGQQELTAARNEGKEDPVLAEIMQWHSTLTYAGFHYYDLLAAATHHERYYDREPFYRIWNASIDANTKLEFGDLAAWVERLLRFQTTLVSRTAYSSDAYETAVKNVEHDEVDKFQKVKKTLETLSICKHKALQDAADMGDHQTVKLLIENSTDPNVQGQDPYHTALSSAARRGHDTIVEYLLAKGADPNQISCTGSWTMLPLEAAASSGSLDIINRLLKAGAELDANVCLHAAAAKGHLSIVRWFLDAGAEVNTFKPNKRVLNELCGQECTALQLAAHGGHLEVVKMLVQEKADVNSPAAPGGRTALQAAVEREFIEIVNILLAERADINAPAAMQGATALQLAAASGNIDLVNLLLQEGATLEMNVPLGIRPALERAAKAGHVKIMERLLQHGDKHVPEKSTDFRLQALHAGTKEGHADVVRFLLEKGTLVKELEQSEALIKSAAKSGDPTIVSLLLKAGADVNYVHHEFQPTALQIAVKAGQREIARLLITAGADVNATKGPNPPLLHLASEQGHIEMVQMLIEMGADVHLDYYGDGTILEAAEKSGNAELIYLLRELRTESTHQEKKSQALDLSLITRTHLCPTCARLPLEVFTKKTQEEGVSWHPSLLALQDSTRNGCPFCVFFWKQLGITTISIPQPSPISLCNSGDGVLTSVICEPYPADIEYARELRAGFYVDVEPFKGKRKRLPGNSASLETISQMQLWLDTCAQSHPKCMPHLNQKCLPTRLLDLSSWMKERVLKLIDTQTLPVGCSPYITLHHDLYAQLDESATTTMASLDLRCTRIAPESLPLTFVHAVEVAQKLGITYLWIDCLCIVQDSQEDRTRELSLWSKIYLNAYCTISAPLPDSPTGGIFRSYKRENASKEFMCQSSDGTPTKVLVFKTQKTWHNLAHTSSVATSGWGLLGKELSPRILHFTESQVLWDCRTCKATESRPTEDMPKEWPPTRKRFIDSIHDLGVNPYDLWYETVAEYTSRDHRKCEDLLLALGILARIFSEHTMTEYVAGLWMDDLVRSLGWTTRYTVDGHKRHKTYVAPTWSFASVSGPTFFQPIKAKFEDVFSDSSCPLGNGPSTITHVTIRNAGLDPFGQIDMGELQISAPILQAVLGYDRCFDYIGQSILLNDVSGQLRIGEMHCDVPSERASLRVVHCIYLYSQEDRHEIGKLKRETGVGLAIIPVMGKRQCYQRIGQIQCLGLHFFEGLEVQSFTLI